SAPEPVLSRIVRSRNNSVVSRLTHRLRLSAMFRCATRAAAQPLNRHAARDAQGCNRRASQRERAQLPLRRTLTAKHVVFLSIIPAATQPTGPVWLRAAREDRLPPIRLPLTQSRLPHTSHDRSASLQKASWSSSAFQLRNLRTQGPCPRPQEPRCAVESGAARRPALRPSPCEGRFRSTAGPRCMLSPRKHPPSPDRETIRQRLRVKESGSVAPPLPHKEMLPSL